MSSLQLAHDNIQPPNQIDMNTGKKMGRKPLDVSSIQFLNKTKQNKNTLVGKNKGYFQGDLEPVTQVSDFSSVK